MAKILAISSQTIFGPVGNSASVPALQQQGHEVLALPTIILSFHPGHGTPAALPMPEPTMQSMLERLMEHGALADCSAVLTGYFTKAEQVAAAAKTIAQLKEQNQKLVVLVDPVIGDDGTLYVPQEVAEAIRDKLLPLATITTPNAFELSWLTRHEVKDEATAADAARKLGVAETLVTSVPSGAALATCLFAGDVKETRKTTRLAEVPHGTGDYLSGLYLALRLNHTPSIAFENAMVKLEATIARSAGGSVLRIF